jgi:hypothetical protein
MLIDAQAAMDVSLLVRLKIIFLSTWRNISIREERFSGLE